MPQQTNQNQVAVISWSGSMEGKANLKFGEKKKKILTDLIPLRYAP